MPFTIVLGLIITGSSSVLRAWVEADILYLHADDVPPYKKKGSVVRNSYFWALRSIAVRATFGKAWEFEAAVWYALQRMLASFMDSGYLATAETQLEFSEVAVIPPVLQPMATWIPIELFMAEPDVRLAEKGVGKQRNGRVALGEEQDAGQESHRGQSQRDWQRRQNLNNRDRPSPPYSSYI